MKKIILGLAVIGILAGIGYVAYEKMGKKGVEIVEILPQDISVFIHFDDVESNLRKLSSMSIWKGLSKINFDRLLSEGNANGQQVMMFKLFQAQVMDVLKHPLAKRLFGNEVAIAIYPVKADLGAAKQNLNALNPKFLEEILSGFYLITRVDSDVQFAEFVTRFFSQIGSNVSQGQVEHKGEVIRTITVNSINMTFGLVRLGDLIVVGVGESAARASINAFKKDIPSLADDADFAQLKRKFLSPANSSSYFNFSEFTKELKAQGDKFVALGNDSQKEQWERVLKQISGIKSFAGSSQLTPLMRFDSHMAFDPGELDKEYAALYTCASTENKTIDFTPQDVLGYYWSNCLNLKHYWQEFQRGLDEANAPDDRLAQMESSLGMSIEGDILPAIGDEIGGYIQDIQVGGMFPVPKFLLFVKVGNKAKADSLLNKLQEQPMMMLQEESYQGIPIKFVGIPLGSDFQPGYAYLNNYLLISTSRSLIQKSIDVSKNPSIALPSSPEFREVNEGLTEPNRGVQFLRVSQIIDKIKTIVGWSNDWMTAQDLKAQAFKAGSNKPLEEVKLSIDEKEGQLSELKERMIALEDDIWNLETKGEDASVKQSELSDAQGQIDSLKLEIADEEERAAELANVVNEMDDGRPDAETRKFYMDEVIFPILDSLKSIKAYGFRGTVRNNSFDSSLILKIAE